jgi:PAS domain S-box-containing protein
MAVQKYDIRRPESEGGGFEERYWSPVNTPVFGDDGCVRHILHRVQDVTDFIRAKQAGSEQQRIVDELQTRAGQMEAEIYRRAQQVQDANAQLREKNEELAGLYDKAAEIDRLKTRFFANVSHELRTPLALILGPVRRLLTEGELPDTDRRDLEVVERNASTLLKHVTDLLDISKLDAGSMQARYKQFDLGHLCRLTASHFETLAHDSGIRFEVSTPKRDVTIQADPEKLERVLVNLVSNAFKATPRGGEIALTLDVAGTDAVLTVADTGPGIPIEMREAVFERFQQVPQAHSTGGTGLGLSIVKEFVALHGGSVRVDASASGGALFTVRLPLTAPPGTTVDASGALAPLPESRTAARAAVAAPAPPEGIDAAPLVLVVEDNPEMNAFIAQTLGRYYRVASAFDGRDGYEKALALHPDLIVSDVMMPVMSGDEMVALLRADEKLKSVPIILLTAKADDDLQARLLRDAVQDYLPKPFRSEVLLARAGNLIDEYERHRAEMRRSYGLLRASTDWITDIIFVKDVEGRYLMVNPAGAEFLRTTVEEAVGRNDAAFFPPEVAAKIRADDLGVMQSGATVTYEEEIATPEGEWIRLTTKGPYLDGNGRVAGLIGLSRDITAQKKAERALAASEARERGFLRDILRSVTEGKLLLADDECDLPRHGEPSAPSQPLTRDSLAVLRREVAAAARSHGFTEDRVHDLITAASEAAMNAVVHAGGGTAQVMMYPDHMIRVWVKDAGTGIDIVSLPNATLEKGYTTAGTLGHGFFLILNTVDCTYLLTGPTGTTVVLEQHLAPPEPFWMFNGDSPKAPA